MNLPQFAVRRPYTVLMIFLAIFLIGLIAIFKLPIDLLPEIEPPVISVIVPYPGATASDVESDVVKFLEDMLSTVPNLDELNSLSKDNLGMVSCKFKWGTNLDVASNDVRDKVDLAKWDIKEHAPDSEEPILFKFSSATAPIMAITISAPSSWPQLYRIVDKKVADSLKRTKGVGAVMVYGGLRRQIKIELDWQKIKAYNLPVSLIIQRLKEENLDFPLGRIKKGKRDYFLRIKKRFKNPEEIKNILITQYKGKPVYLKDIAKVSDDFEEEKMKGYCNGKETIILIVQKQSGENTVEVCNNIKKTLEKVKKFLPRDAEITIPMDGSEFILMAIKNLAQTVVIAGILVVIVTLLFLRRSRASLIISLSIPFSLICAFIFLYGGGFTVNVISLMSLAIAIGMVVDNAIVVLENITRHVEEGEKPREAAIFASGEVGEAIFASTLTTVCVFIPLIFVTGLAGIIFKQLGVVVSITIFSSLFVALTLTPMLASKWIRKETYTEKNKLSKFYLLGEKFFKNIEAVYVKILDYALFHKKKILASLIVTFFVSIFLARFIGQDLFPDVDTGDIDIMFRLNESARIEETDKILKKFGKIYEKLVPERKYYYTFAGESEKGIGVALGMEEGPNVGEGGAKLVPRTERKRSVYEIAQILRKEIEKIPGIEKLKVIATTPIKQVFMSGKGKIEVELIGSDLDKLQKYAERLEKEMKKIPGAIDVRSSFKKPRLELHIDIDREKANLLGVNTAVLASTLRSYFYGYEATKFREAGDDFDIFLQLKEKQRYSLDDIGEISVPTMSDKLVKLKTFAKVNMGLGPVEINRKNRERIISVGCDIYKRAMSDV
ncbi:MAG: AcrB/AcrD/AcrF family protein, partial [Candidatus Omnitrophota bacterium]